jgi:hypothetical protein
VEVRSFNEPLPNDIFYRLEKGIIILNRLRREAPRISTETYQESLNVLAEDELNNLTHSDHHEFILLLIQNLKLEDIHHVIPHWNADISCSILEICEQMFREIVVEDLPRLRVNAQLLLSTGNLEELLTRFWRYVNQNSSTDQPQGSYRVFFSLMNAIPQDYQLVTQNTENMLEKDCIQPLVSWALGSGLSLKEVMIWANLVVNISNPVTEQLFSFYLGKLQNDSTPQMTLLMTVCGLIQDPQPMDLQAIGFAELDLLVLLLQAAVVRGTQEKYFTGIAHRIIECQKQDAIIALPMVQQGLAGSNMSTAKLTAKEIALLDEIRLSADLYHLNSFNMLDKGKEDIEVYYQELKAFLSTLLPDKRLRIVDGLYAQLTGLIPKLAGNDALTNHLYRLCLMLQQVSIDRLRWDRLIFQIYLEPIRTVVVDRASVDSLVTASLPLLEIKIADDSNQQQRRNWLGLIDFLSSRHYPDTALSLVQFSTLCGSELTRRGSNGNAFVRQLQISVINDKKILIDPSERERYIERIGRNILDQVELLGILRPGLLVSPMGRKVFEHLSNLLIKLIR